MIRGRRAAGLAKAMICRNPRHKRMQRRYFHRALTMMWRLSVIRRFKLPPKPVPPQAPSLIMPKTMQMPDHPAPAA